MAKKEKLKAEVSAKEVSGVVCHRCGDDDMKLLKDVANEKVYECKKCGAVLSQMPSVPKRAF